MGGGDDVDALLIEEAIEAGDETGTTLDQFRWRHGLRCFDEEIDVAPAPVVIHARTEQEYGRTGVNTS
jgi:hypothetical protein